MDHVHWSSILESWIVETRSSEFHPCLLASRRYIAGVPSLFFLVRFFSSLCLCLISWSHFVSTCTDLVIGSAVIPLLAGLWRMRISAKIFQSVSAIRLFEVGRYISASVFAFRQYGGYSSAYPPKNVLSH
ncbi:hypothetical protein V1506DRAFT_533352 [Lipomyces tetrasporus]